MSFLNKLFGNKTEKLQNNKSSTPTSTPNKTPLAVLIVANGQPPSRFECDAIIKSIPEFQGEFTVRPMGGGAPLPDPNDSRATGMSAGVLVYLNFPEFMDENITYRWRDGKLVIAIFKK